MLKSHTVFLESVLRSKNLILLFLFVVQLAVALSAFLLDIGHFKESGPFPFYPGCCNDTRALSHLLNMQLV